MQPDNCNSVQAVGAEQWARELAAAALLHGTPQTHSVTPKSRPRLDASE